MDVRAKIDQDLAEAMKRQDADRVKVLRLLKTALANERIKVGHDLDDAEMARVLNREAKQRRDSIEAYRGAGRDELAAGEEAELEVIEGYLPKQLSEAELAAIVDKAILQVGAADKSQMGRVMSLAMSEVAGRADGATVSKLVNQRLS